MTTDTPADPEPIANETESGYARRRELVADARATLNRCRICGFTGPLVTPGIYKLASGKFVTIQRCQDHLACDTRKAAL
jgi:hypothetical protein